MKKVLVVLITVYCQIIFAQKTEYTAASSVSNLQNNTQQEPKTKQLNAILSAASSPRRHCQLGVRCPKLAIHEVWIFMYLLVKASSLD